MDHAPEREIFERSYVDSEIAAIEAEKDPADRVLLAATFFHDLWTSKRSAVTRDRRTSFGGFVSGKDGGVYIQAGVPASLINEDIYTVRLLPDDQRHQPIPKYWTHEHVLVRVPQCHMLRIPKSSNPYAYLTMSTCSAVIGETDRDIWVAHVGLSERGGLQEFVRAMKTNGIPENNLYAVASLGKNYSKLERGVKTPRFDYSRVESIKDFTALGIREDHIIPFKHYYEKTAGRTVNKDLCAVIVSANYVAAYTFDELSGRIDSTRPRDITKPKDVSVLSFRT